MFRRAVVAGARSYPGQADELRHVPHIEELAQLVVSPFCSRGPDLLTLGERAAQVARAQGAEAGRLLYLWRDAVATFLFDRFARQ